MYATIDIGTNSVRLLIAKEVKGKLIPVKTQMMITRLGQGLNESKQLCDEAIGRTLAAVLAYKQVLNKYKVENLKIIATSAVRDATNQVDFISYIKKKTGWDLQVLSGKEEAKASFLGAVKLLTVEGHLADYECDADVVVLDIGGGSTELIKGRIDGRIISGESAQVGAVRMTEMFVTCHPVVNSELAQMRAEIEKRVEPLIDKCCTQGTLIGVGGTITTLAALELELPDYRPQLITGFRLTYDVVENWLNRLAQMDLTTRANLTGMNNGREDIIVAGIAVLKTVMDLGSIKEMVVSEGDLLQGVWCENLVSY